MTLPKDPVILLSYVNTRLRDCYDSLEALCEDMEIPCGELCDRLACVGYRYDAARNQFR